MNPFMKKAMFGIFGGTLVLGSLGACAGRGHAGWGEGGPGSPEFQAQMVDRIGSKLVLDPTQKQKLGVLAEKLQTQRTAMRGSTGPRDIFRGLIAGDKFDQAGAAKLVEEKTAVVRRAGPEVIAAAADFFDTLRPEQQQKVREFMNRRGGGRGWGSRG